MTITKSDIPDDWGLFQDQQNRDRAEYQMKLTRGGGSDVYAMVSVKQSDGGYSVTAQHESAGEFPMGGLPVATYRTFEAAEDAHNFAVELVNNLHKWPELPKWKSDQESQ
jgi:hypothetical protein